MSDLYCAKCGKRIMPLQSMMFDGGLPYHSQCGEALPDCQTKEESHIFGVGKYHTRCGFKAIVAQVNSVDGNRWALRGAIECPKTKVLMTCEWDLMGKLRCDDITHHGQFDLVQKA